MLQDEAEDEAGRLQSGELAAFIVDALLRANLLNAVDVERAIAVAAEEIEVQKVMGGY